VLAVFAHALIADHGGAAGIVQTREAVFNGFAATWGYTAVSVRRVGQRITPVFRITDSDTIVNSCAVANTFNVTADAVVANFETT
jgi:hypothetical protein